MYSVLHCKGNVFYRLSCECICPLCYANQGHHRNCSDLRYYSYFLCVNSVLINKIASVRRMCVRVFCTTLKFFIVYINLHIIYMCLCIGRLNKRQTIDYLQFTSIINSYSLLPSVVVPYNLPYRDLSLNVF